MTIARVIHGDAIDAMLQMDADSVDAIVTDPPYGLGFMGKKWDALPPGQAWAEAALHVLKPGGHLLAFGGTRTWHRLAVAVEDAGFEIRDSIAWIYGTGFPKHKATLKPAFEPVVMARKPFKGSLVANVAKHGVGLLNIDECRIGETVETWPASRRYGGGRGDAPAASAVAFGRDSSPARTQATGEAPAGRWPANVILDECTREQVGGPAKFFYAAKAPKSERPVVDGIAHPTVKPLSLMRHLVKLVTPAGGTILDPFAGTGTTLEAATLEGFHSIGIERESDYLPLIHARLNRQELN